MPNVQSSLGPVETPAAAALARLHSYSFFLHNNIDIRQLKWVEASNPKHRRLCVVDSTTGVETTVTFVAIGRLATGQYRYKLLPEGELAGGGKAADKKLNKIAATGELTQPDALDKAGGTMLRDTWPRVLQTCDAIVNSARAPSSAGSEPVPCYSFNSNGNIKFKHNLFTDAIKDDSDTTISDDNDDTAPTGGAAISSKHDGMAFHISQWPMPDAHKADFEALKASKDYDIVPIPAYDSDGEPIRPSRYRSQLEGALVELHFSVESWNFPEKAGKSTAKDTVSAILTRVDVLDPKRPDLPTSPMKPRRVKRQGSPLSSPSKRREVQEQNTKID